MNPNPIVFTGVLVGALALFSLSCVLRFRLVAIGNTEKRFDHIGLRLKNMFVYAFLQKRVLDKPFGINHFVLFWSFMILMLANIEFSVHGVVPSLSFARLPDYIYHPLLLLFDCVSLLALICVVVAAIRRIVWPPYAQALTIDAFVVLGLVALLMIAYFNVNAAGLAAGKIHAAQFMPFSNALSGLVYTDLNSNVLESRMLAWWWVHAAVLLIFLNYLPYSKHMHILTSIPNCFFKRIEPPNTLPREEFIKGNTFGANSVDALSWKDLLDAFSCTECGRCQNVCPATQTGKPLNPRTFIHALKMNLLQSGPGLRKDQTTMLPLIGADYATAISPDALWSCTTCGACMEVCPVFIEQMPKLIILRRYLVEMQAHFPEELLNLFENMEQRSNPWGMAPADRIKWCSGHDIKIYNQDIEYLLFVGCAGTFDARNKQVTLALAAILDAAGISWGILGKDEACCGDSLRRLGNEYIFDKMARANIDLFKARGVKKIITLCPHCFSTLKNDYSQYGLEAEVIHHTSLINELICAGRLNLKTGIYGDGRIVFHDSCYLGRHNAVYDAPRIAIKVITGQLPIEMARKGRNSFCCGAGGGRMWMEEHLGTRINIARVQEALQSKPDTVCVTCPYCMTMFEDGLKDKNSPNVAVKDIAELVAERLQ